MNVLSAWLTLLVVLIAAPAAAHDIGVDQAELVEQEDGHYQLRAYAGSARIAGFDSPMLPEHCRFTSTPTGERARNSITFSFACNGGLTGDDTIQLPWRRDGIMLTTYWRDGPTVRALFRHDAGRIKIPLSELQAGSGSLSRAIERYTGLGIEHILFGFDHLLFVLALLMIVSNGWALVKTITAFTLAHSITLGLATLDYIHVPSQPVEAVIALSIVFLCVEIMHARRNRPGLTYRYPWLIAFAFGLLHGLGFAGALAKIGLPQAEIPVALLFFNIGVELGQLLFVAIVLVIIWFLGRFKFAQHDWARATPVYVIGSVASFWLFERVAGILPT